MSVSDALACTFLGIVGAAVFIAWIANLAISSSDYSSTKGVRTSSMPTYGFYKVFEDRLGLTPSQFIEQKLKAGSAPCDIEYEYELIAAKIQQQSGCAAPPFKSIFRPYMMYLKPDVTAKSPILPQKETPKAEAVTAAKQEPPEQRSPSPAAPVLQPPETQNATICIRELLHKQQFLEMYPQRLWNLAHDKSFMQGINAIQAENRDVEFTADRNDPTFKRFKLHTLPSAFTKSLLDLDPDYQTIEEHVVSRGCSKVSAMISVYYAMRLYQM